MEEEERGRQRDEPLDQRQHEGVPQVQVDHREERRVQPHRVQELQLQGLLELIQFGVL